MKKLALLPMLLILPLTSCSFMGVNEQQQGYKEYEEYIEKIEDIEKQILDNNPEVIEQKETGTSETTNSLLSNEEIEFFTVFLKEWSNNPQAHNSVELEETINSYRELDRQSANKLVTDMRFAKYTISQENSNKVSDTRVELFVISEPDSAMNLTQFVLVKTNDVWVVEDVYYKSDSDEEISVIDIISFSLMMEDLFL